MRELKACFACQTIWYGDPSDEVNRCPICGHERETLLGETRELLRKEQRDNVFGAPNRSR
jgi:rRNA maturation endonuclease Nob1